MFERDAGRGEIAQGKIAPLHHSAFCLKIPPSAKEPRRSFAFLWESNPSSNATSARSQI